MREPEDLAIVVYGYRLTLHYSAKQALYPKLRMRVRRHLESFVSALAFVLVLAFVSASTAAAATV
jgi:hypothetical protein